MRAWVVVLLIGCGNSATPPDADDTPPGAAWRKQVIDVLTQPTVAPFAIDTSAINVSIAQLGAQLGVSYYKIPEQEQRVALETATGWDKNTVELGGTGGGTLALSPTGPAVSYITGASAADIYAIHYATFDGTTWTFESASEGGGADNYYTNPTTLVFDAAGSPVVVGAKGEGPQKPVILRQSGATWMAEVVPTTDAYAENIAAVLDAAGNPHIVYAGSRLDATSGMNRFYQRAVYGAFDGTNWTFEELAPENLSAGNFGFNGFSIAIDAQGQDHVVYGSIGPSAELLWTYGVRDATGTWTNLAIDHAGTASMTMDATGGIHVAVGTDIGQIEYRRPIAGGWSKTLAAKVETDGDNRGLGIAIDSAGLPAIVYADAQSGEIDVARLVP